MHISKLDPSCCLGFYCANEEEFEEFIKESSKFLLPPQLKTNCPLFLFAEGSVRDHNKYVSKTNKDSIFNSSMTNSEEFSILNDDLAQPSSCNQVTNDDSSKPSASELGSNSDDEYGSSHSNVSEVAKSDIFSLSLSKPRQFITNFYRQQSRSPKSKHKNISLEEEFELL